MAGFNTGDLCTLISGSPKFAVEKMEGRTVFCVWCNDGVIHRDQFDANLLRRWEEREDSRGGDRSDPGRSFSDRPRGGGKPFGDKPRGGGKPFGDKPRGGKPSFGDKKDKPFYRKD